MKKDERSKRIVRDGRKHPGLFHDTGLGLILWRVKLKEERGQHFYVGVLHLRSRRDYVDHRWLLPVVFR